MSDKQNPRQIIFILGPPGAGKSYLCKRANGELADVEHVIMSDLLSAEGTRPDSQWAQEINAKLPTGVLVSSETSTAVLDAWLDSLPEGQSTTYLLDGFPRNMDQARAFVEKWGNAKGVISLTCSQGVMAERRKKRARVDDDPKIAEGRYRSHVEDTLPAIAYVKGVVQGAAEVSFVAALPRRRMDRG
ncbi:MAG: hypothetical protein Q9224_005738 [Gallowayella concinna]